MPRRPVTLDSILADIAALPALQRAQLLAQLVSHDTGQRLGALRRAAVYELTRRRTYAEVAADLGVSVAAVNKAVTEHRRDTAPTQ